MKQNEPRDRHFVTEWVDVLLRRLLYLKSSASYPWLIYACVHVRLAVGGHWKAQLRFKETTSSELHFWFEDALAENVPRTAPAKEIMRNKLAKRSFS